MVFGPAIEGPLFCPEIPGLSNHSRVTLTKIGQKSSENL